MRRMVRKEIPIVQTKGAVSSESVPISKLEALFPERSMSPYYTQRDERQLMRMGLYACSVAAAAIGVIARQITAATLRVYRERGDGTLQEDRSHWLRQVIIRPNGFTSEKELWYKTTLHLLSAGASFWELRRQNPASTAQEVREIHLLPPHCVRVLADDEEIKGYEYWRQGVGRGKQKVDFAVQQVLRLPYPDAMENYGHASPLSSVFKEMMLDSEATLLVYDFIRNDAVPPLLLSVEGDIDEEEANDIEERWWQRFGRYSKKRGRPGVIGGGTKPHQLSTNFKDMGFQEVRAHVETRICAALGVDPVLLPTWIGVSEANTHANFESARRHLWDNTIIPILQLIESKINSQLLWNESGTVARFDLSEVDALKEKKENQWKRTTEAFKVGLLTVNQALQELGKDAIGEEGEARIFDLQKEALMARAQMGFRPEQEGQEEDDNGSKSGTPTPETKQLDEDDRSALIDGLMAAQREAEEDFRKRMKDFFASKSGR